MVTEAVQKRMRPHTERASLSPNFVFLFSSFLSLYDTILGITLTSAWLSWLSSVVSEQEKARRVLGLRTEAACNRPSVPAGNSREQKGKKRKKEWRENNVRQSRTREDQVRRVLGLRTEGSGMKTTPWTRWQPERK